LAASIVLGKRYQIQDRNGTWLMDCLLHRIV
jgi:hypothetical protein